MHNKNPLLTKLMLLFGVAMIGASAGALAKSAVTAKIEALSEQGQREKIPRQAGAVQEEFKSMLNDVRKQFKSGIGRIELVGVANTSSCHADLYLGDNSSYIALYSDDLAYSEEFYLDHPVQAFKDVLFQYRVTLKESVSLVVNKKHGQYLITRQGDMLTVLVDSKGLESPECRFKLSDARVYDGETE